MTRYTPPKVTPPTKPTRGEDIAARLRDVEPSQLTCDEAAAYILELETAMKVMITDRLNWQRGHKTIR